MRSMVTTGRMVGAPSAMLPLDSTTPAFGRAALLCYSTSVMAPGGIALIFDMDNTVLGSRIDFTAIRRELVSVLRAARATAEAPDALMGRAIAELVALGAAHDRAHRTQLVPELWRIIEAHEAAGLQDASALDGALPCCARCGIAGTASRS